MQRNFWFCSLEDCAAFDVRHAIGVENITIETDYPHLDATWPESQATLWRQIGDLPPDEIAAIAWRNAAELFGHEVPDAVVEDPERF